MSANMLKISRKPPHQDEGDLYERIKTRPGTTEKKKKLDEMPTQNCSKLMPGGLAAPYLVLLSPKTLKNKADQDS